jgi:hypothetical protein
MAGRRLAERAVGARERPAVNCNGKAKNPCPVSNVGPSPPGGLVHPNATTVADRCCVTVSGILNLD